MEGKIAYIFHWEDVSDLPESDIMELYRIAKKVEEIRKSKEGNQQCQDKKL